MPQVSYQKGKRICDMCRHYYPKRELKSCHRGQFCRSCYDKKVSRGEAIE